jgi:Polysaccharide deacetylase
MGRSTCELTRVATAALTDRMRQAVPPSQSEYILKARSHALMYHDVVSGDSDTSGFRGPEAARYKLSWKAFVSHLDAIGQSTDAPPLIIDELACAEPIFWSLTFDDGGASMLAVGEELARRSWRGHFFVATNLIGDPGFLDGPAIRELRQMGHMIGSHSVSHPRRMSSLPQDELRKEWQLSVAELSELLDERVHIASVPGGYYAKRVAEEAFKAGITTLFTSEPVRKLRWVRECLVIGRLSLLRSTSDREAAMAAAGHSSPWRRRYLGWNLRKPLKAIAGNRYEPLLARLRAPSHRISPL